MLQGAEPRTVELKAEETVFIDTGFTAIVITCENDLASGQAGYGERLCHVFFFFEFLFKKRSDNLNPVSSRFARFFELVAPDQSLLD